MYIHTYAERSKKATSRKSSAASDLNISSITNITTTVIITNIIVIIIINSSSSSSSSSNNIIIENSCDYHYQYYYYHYWRPEADGDVLRAELREQRAPEIPGHICTDGFRV